MRIMVLGADGYLGWPTAMHLAAEGHSVMVIDNYLKRTLEHQTNSESLVPLPNLDERVHLFEEMTGLHIRARIGDVDNYEFLSTLFKEFQPGAVVHYAEQPSGPYSMIGHKEAELTLTNNLSTTLNVVWAVLEHCPNCHIVKLGTMGEYGIPNVDIPEGWFDLDLNGRQQRALFPREAGSLYHTTKILDTDLLWFYTRTYGLRVTDLMQGPVYGVATEQTKLHDQLGTSFHYDDIFGTVVNRFLVQAVAGHPLTVYGQGGQTRGYINLQDVMRCVQLACETPADPGELRIFNQITEILSVNEIAQKVVEAAPDWKVEVESLDNPRKESEDHYYNPTYTGLQELGLEPTLMTREVLSEMLCAIIPYSNEIDELKIIPRVRWER